MTFECEIREDFEQKFEKIENEKVNEQLIDNFFIDFDMFLFVANVKIERFDEMIVLKNISDSNVWFRDIAKEINETNCEINEQIIVDFFTNLYADSSAKTRKSELLTDFRA